MCTWAETEKLDGSGDVVTSVYELARSLGCAPSDLVSRSGQPMDEDECLCDLDEEATGKKLGYAVTFYPEDRFDVLFTQEKH